jgi:pilus assembly protein CpaE
LPRSTIADVVAEKGQLEDKTLAAYMTTYNDQLQILAAPLRPEQAESVTGTLVGAILKQLRSSYDFIIVDTASSFSEVTIAALDAADRVLLVAALDLPAVKNTKLALEIMQSLGYGDEKIILALNRNNPEGGIDIREVEESLKRPFTISIPSDGKTVVSSINRGLPFVVTTPAAPVAQRIQALASVISPQESESTDPVGKSSLRFKFFGR